MALAWAMLAGQRYGIVTAQNRRRIAGQLLQGRRQPNTQDPVGHVEGTASGRLPDQAVDGDGDEEHQHELADHS
jgi:hypothetical protein